MNVTVIGTGFVGVVTAAVFAHFKNNVFALDIDEKKIKSLTQGKIPFFEPNLEDLVKKGINQKKLHFTTEYKTAIEKADVVIIAVGTPSAPDGTADLKYIFAASKALAPFLKSNSIVAVKSTVPPGTNEKIKTIIDQYTKTPYFIVSLPEFLKEGSAVADTLNPDRIIIGATDRTVIDTLRTLHKPFGGKRIITSPQSAQLAKYAANAYLAQRITFINQIANLCEKNGADVNQIIEAIGADRRIGTHYWYPGLGYGGSCFPKDVKELAAYSRSIGEGDGLFVKLDELNEKRIPRLMKKFETKVGGWKGKRIALLGLSFKPNTDDIREAPSLTIIPILKKADATLIGYDPQVKSSAHPLFSSLEFAPSPQAAIKGADIVFILVEWPQLIDLNLKETKTLMQGVWFIDARNQYDQNKVIEVGLNYVGIGR